MDAQQQQYNFDCAYRELPRCVSGFDPCYHKTADQLAFLALHELDMYEEDEDSDIKTQGDARTVRAYIKRWKENNMSSRFTFYVQLVDDTDADIGEDVFELYEGPSRCLATDAFQRAKRAGLFPGVELQMVRRDNVKRTNYLMEKFII